MDLRLLPRGACLLACGVWALFVWRHWDAEAVFRRVYPDNRLRNLVEQPAELGEAQALELVQNAAARVPPAPHFQAGLGEKLRAYAFDPASDDSSGDRVFDGAIGAYVRSLWGNPLQPKLMLDLVAAAEPIYQPDPGTEPGVLYELVGRAAALAPYEPALQLQVANWYLGNWESFPAVTRVEAADRIEAALALAARSPWLRSQVPAATKRYEEISKPELRMSNLVPWRGRGGW